MGEPGSGERMTRSPRPLRRALPTASIPVRVLLVDDHVLVRQGLRSVLEGAGRVEVVGEAGSPGEALRLIESDEPDVVLLDLRLGDEDGIEVARHCRAQGTDVKILVVSAHGSSVELRAAMAAGAHGYLLKGVTAAQLVDGLRKVAAGETVIDVAFVPVLIGDVVTGQETRPVTVREVEVLTLLADGWSSSRVARELGISPRTVQKHVEHLYQKLGASSRAELVQLAFRKGLLR